MLQFVGQDDAVFVENMNVVRRTFKAFRDRDLATLVEGIEGVGGPNVDARSRDKLIVIYRR